MDYRPAQLADVAGIVEVCQDAYYTAYQKLIPKEQLEKDIQFYFSTERVQQEIQADLPSWCGYFVAVEGNKVIGAIGGGFMDAETSGVYVFYLDPKRKREGIGKNLLALLTRNQIQDGAKKQGLTVVKDNWLGIPFYEAQGFLLCHEEEMYPESLLTVKSLYYQRDLN